MDYRKLINEAYEKAEAKNLSVDKTLPMAEMVDEFNRALTEYEEATEIIVGRLNQESPESVEDAERLILEKKELIVGMPK